jgi:hypothetical protein
MKVSFKTRVPLLVDSRTGTENAQIIEKSLGKQRTGILGVLAVGEDVNDKRDGTDRAEIS